MQNNFKFLKITLLFLIALNLIIWCFVLFPSYLSTPEFYFLKIGQGDSSLVLLPGKSGNYVKFLIDGGPIGGNLQLNLEKILGANRYIDLVIVSHPHIDHFGGLIKILKNYKVGAVLYNGEDIDSENWKEFDRIILEKNIPKIILYKKDKIIYSESYLNIVNSTSSIYGNIDDSSLVFLLESEGVRTLFTGDIGFSAEKALVNSSEDITADILKVPHHGSKFSSSLEFLKKVKPKISVIEVGKNNYGHPANETLKRLADVGSQILLTREDGIIKIINNNNELKIYTIDI
ncbi:MBL fold metallo-hydrolase [Patescibacteria group bacterium]|nr:MBL fold metallo-hydrolase [Patescibacteria group bacterium]